MSDVTGVVLAVFAAVVLACLGIYSVWVTRYSAESRRVNARLQALVASAEAGRSPSVERHADVSRLPFVQKMLAESASGKKLIDHVDQAGGGVSAGDLLALSLVMGLVGYFLPALFGKPSIFGYTTGFVMFAIPWWRMSSARQKRVSKLEQQFPEALDLMVRSLRAGHALPSAVRLCGEEMMAPIGPEFRLLADETNYGVPIAQSLQSLSERVPIPDIGYFVVAVLIQRESGGNMAELLTNISQIVRQRLKLHGEIKTMTAEGRLSAWIMGLLPFAIGFIINLMKPGYMTVLWTDPRGSAMLGTALLLMVVGAIWMYKIVQIRV